MIKVKTIKLLVLILIVLLQSGCKITFLGRTEINKIEFIRVLGIDKSTEKEGYVRLTISTQRIQAETSGDGSKNQSRIIVSEGKTVFEAVRNFWNYMDRKPFWGHIEYVLIGEEVAKDGIMKYIDFFCRDPEVRLDLRIYQTRGCNAEEVIAKASSEERFIYDQLQGATENQPGQSVLNVVDMVEVMYILDREYLCLYIPCLELQQKTKPTSKDNAMDITMGGFALFEGDKLAAHLDTEMGRGLNWLMNQVKTGIITVKSPKGNNISLEIIESNVKLKPALSDGKLTVQVNAYVTANIAEVQGSEDVFTQEGVSYLEEQMQEAVKNEIEAVIHFAQEKDMDFFSTGDAVFHRYPIQWEDEFEKKWKTVFSEVVFKVDVTPAITGTYNISQPNRTKKEESP